MWIEVGVRGRGFLLEGVGVVFSVYGLKYFSVNFERDSVIE